MLLAIEIGGTKLQLGVGSGDGGRLRELRRIDVEPEQGAEGIRRQLKELVAPVLKDHRLSALAVGFGGPVDATTGRTILSHQVDGWEDYPLAEWCQRKFGLPTVLGNDSDLGGLAEARFGAGKGHRVVFYANIGSGIGGALVIDGQLYCGSGNAASELGHLRPGLQSDRPDQTLESIASGWAIAAAAQARIAEPVSHPLEPLQEGYLPHNREAIRQRLIEQEEVDEASAADLLERCDGQVETLTTAIVADAARKGNPLAREVFEHACQAFGWGLAQMITLLAPNVVVLGGGVCMAGEKLVLKPIRKHVDRYVFPPLRGTYEIVPAQLGEEMVLHGALALAAATGSR